MKLILDMFRKEIGLLFGLTMKQCGPPFPHPLLRILLPLYGLTFFRGSNPLSGRDVE